MPGPQYISFERTIPGNSKIDLFVPGKSFVITAWTTAGSLSPKIAFNEKSEFYEIPKGLNVDTEGFAALSIQNPNAQNAVVKVSIAQKALFFLNEPAAVSVSGNLKFTYFI